MLFIKYIRKIFIIGSIIIISLQLSCEEILKLEVAGDGNIIVDTLRWKDNYNIENIELTDNFKLEIYQSEIPALHVEADSNLMSFIKTDYNRRTLTIRRQSNYNLSPRKKIIVRLYINNINNINISNGGIALCDTFELRKLSVAVLGKSSFQSNQIVVNEMTCKAESEATINIDGQFSNLELTQLGSGVSYLSGNATNLSIIQEGSGKFEALEMIASNANITLNGSGLIYCYVTDFLNVTIRGSGRVYYKGTPQLYQSIEGEGMIVEY